MTDHMPHAQPRWLGWVLAGAAALSAVAALASADASPGVLGWLLAPALAVVLLVLGRTRPVVALLLSVVLVFAYYASGRATIGLELLLAPALINAAERGRLRSASIIAAGVLALAYTIRIAALGQSFQILGVQFLTSVVVVGGALAAGEVIRARHAWRDELGHRHRLELEAKEALLVRQADEQRRSLARDIHDVLAHALVVVGQQAAIAEATIDTSPSQARESLGVVGRTVKQARSEVSDAVRLLRDGAPEPLTPTAGLADLDSLAAAGEGLTVTVTRPPLPRVGTAVESTAFNIAREALTNVRRHSSATEAEVSLAARGDRLLLTIADNGSPTLPLRPGNGITGMRERAALVGGTLEVVGAPDGVTVTADLPIGGGR